MFVQNVVFGTQVQNMKSFLFFQSTMISYLPSEIQPIQYQSRQVFFESFGQFFLNLNFEKSFDRATFGMVDLSIARVRWAIVGLPVPWASGSCQASLRCVGRFRADPLGRAGWLHHVSWALGSCWVLLAAKPPGMCLLKQQWNKKCQPNTVVYCSRIWLFYTVRIH